MNKADITWFSKLCSLKPENILNEISQSWWTITGNGSGEILCTNDLFYELTLSQAISLNAGKSIYDQRTKGAKWLKKMTNKKTGLIKTIKIYETDFGILSLKEQK